MSRSARRRGSGPSPPGRATAGRRSTCCPAGSPAGPDERFHRILDDDLFGPLVGTIRGVGISHNNACPDCGRVLATTIKRLADPQLRLFVRSDGGDRQLDHRAALDAMKRRGWVKRTREPLPEERRVLVRLWHPHQTIGEGADRHQTAVETFRSLALEEPQPSQPAQPLPDHPLIQETRIMSAPHHPSIDLQVSRGTGLHLQINGRAVDDTYGAIVMAELAQLREEFPCRKGRRRLPVHVAPGLGRRGALDRHRA